MAPKPKGKPNPSKAPSHPTRQEETNEPPCEFTHPCTTSTSSTGGTSRQGSHPRKLISHIFGRNKTSTKLFPPHVWVHYCRKHYQRARYRARAWPFTQCELLLDSFARMEAWGGVESFEVVLRRREVERLSSSSSSSQSSGVGVRLRNGTRRGGTSASTPVSTSVSACASDDDDEYGDEDKDEEADEADEDSSSDDDVKTKNKRTKQKAKVGRRRKPRIKACPVPEWLRAETGAGKSFAEIRAIVARIRADLAEQHQQIQKAKGKSNEQVLFPDIEILPTFQEWVLEKAGENVEGMGKKMSRVSSKGAVQKVQR